MTKVNKIKKNGQRVEAWRGIMTTELRDSLNKDIFMNGDRDMSYFLTDKRYFLEDELRDEVKVIFEEMVSNGLKSFLRYVSYIAREYCNPYCSSGAYDCRHLLCDMLIDRLGVFAINDYMYDEVDMDDYLEEWSEERDNDIFDTGRVGTVCNIEVFMEDMFGEDTSVDWYVFVYYEKGELVAYCSKRQGRYEYEYVFREHELLENTKREKEMYR